MGPVLTLNAGSSSLKFSVFDGAAEVLRGQVSGIGKHPSIEARVDGRQLPPPAPQGRTHEEVLPGLLDWIGGQLGGRAIAAAGHRVVHGGTGFVDPVRITDAVMQGLEALVPLAPLHQPHNLAAIRAVRQAMPDLPQAATFDTAFHSTMPAVATWLALPHALRAAGLRRYGFHGLSYEFIAGRLRELSPAVAAGRVLVCHLGNGASLCAMVDGRSVETTMGFTALDGLVMGTRCGALDPGAVLYLMQERSLSSDAVEDMLYHQSGLLGVSGVSGDMRDLAASSDPGAREAVDLFIHRLVACAGGMIACMGGIGAIVFTGGIGEHDADVRRRVCIALSWLGLSLDDAANAAGGTGRFSRDGNQVEAWVIPTDEEAMIARHTLAVLD